jgi:hypothetical protein
MPGLAICLQWPACHHAMFVKLFSCPASVRAMPSDYEPCKSGFTIIYCYQRRIVVFLQQTPFGSLLLYHTQSFAAMHCAGKVMFDGHLDRREIFNKLALGVH